ncbi:hypothetical protein IQ07DRAFT_432086 [Pyrenochaeta sp. DS3sAY3a]|nr:hypothetical protein IQ07DRAFT_432086 [Pyrenochaeta sp. DS3sAY3a]
MAYRDPGRVLIVVGFTLTAFSTLVVGLRLYIRYFRLRMAGVSDYIMFLSLIFTWGITCINYGQTKFGKDARLSQVEKFPNSPRVKAALSGTLITWFVYRPLYILTISLVKLSILAFYRTLVPPATPLRSFRIFRFTVHSLIIFLILYALATITASIFQCAPISAAYSVTASVSQLPNHQNIPRPRCYKPTTIWVFVSVVNFATDLIIFVLPIPIVVALHKMPRRKRLAIFGVFSIATLAVAASAVRMYILVLWGKDFRTQNKYGTELLTWGQIELNCAIVGASMMFLRPLFVCPFEHKPARPKAVERKAAEADDADAKERDDDGGLLEKLVEAGVSGVHEPDKVRAVPMADDGKALGAALGYPRKELTHGHAQR